MTACGAQVPPVLFWARVFLNAQRLQRKQALQEQEDSDRERQRKVGVRIAFFLCACRRRALQRCQ